MKKIILTALTLFVVAMPVCKAQDNNDSRSIRLSYGYMGGTISAGTPVRDVTNYYSGTSLLLDADLWRLRDGFSIGFYAGCGPASYAETSTSSIIATPAFRWGIGVHWHLLSAIEKESSRWDIALNGSLGSYWSLHAQPQAEYSASASVTFYPLPHWGLSLESGWGKFAFSRYNDAHLGYGSTILKAGISYRF